MTREEKQYIKMTKTPTKKLVLILGIPTVVSMLVTAIYNIADTFFVAQLGTSASGAVGVVFSLMAIIQAVGFTLGMGSGSLISAKLGEKKNDEAQVYSSCAFYFAIILGLLVMTFGLIFITPIMKLLGSTATVLPYAKDYAKYILFGAPIMAGSFVLNNQLRAEGKSRLSMIGLATGGILNIILDPIFIYSLDLGISGAAIATLISQTVSFLILLSFFVFRKTLMRISIKKLSRNVSRYFDIIKMGFPSFARQGLACLATILLNNQAGIYGDDPALSAMGIVSKVLMVVFSIALGIGQGYQPVCGYNYAAKKYDRVKEAMIFTFLVSTIIMVSLCIICFIFSEEIIKIFLKKDAEVVKIGTRALRFQCVSLPFISLNVMSNMTFQSIRKKFKASLLSCCRQGIFFIPLVFLFPYLWGLTGVEMIQAGSDILTFLFTVPFAYFFVKQLNVLIKKQHEEELVLENIG